MFTDIKTRPTSYGNIAISTVILPSGKAGHY